MGRWLGLMLAGLVALQVSPARADGLDAARVDALIGQLGHEDFAQRRKASEELLAAGRPALEILRKHRETDDPEVRLRIDRIIAQVLAAGHELTWMDPSLEGTPAARSGMDVEGVKMAFRNLSGQPVRIFWLQWNGTRRPWRGPLAPGATAVCERTYKGHLWLITDLEGKGLGIYLVDRDEPVLVVRDAPNNP